MSHHTTAAGPSLTTLALGAALIAGLAGTAQAAPAAPAPAALAQPVTTSTLAQGATLSAGQSLVSPNGRFSLALQPDGRLVYRVAPNRLSPQGSETVLSVGSGTGAFVPGSHLAFQDDGNIVLYAPDRSVVRDLGSQGLGARRLVVQDDGNVVLYTADNKAVPAPYTFPALGNASDELALGGVMLPGDRRVSGDGDLLVMQTDGNLVLYGHDRVLFASGSANHPGAAVAMQRDGNVVVYGAKNEVLFTTGTAGKMPSDQDGLVVGNDEFRIFRGNAGNEAIYASSWQSATVLPGDVLYPGDRRTSPGGTYRLNLTVGGDLSVVGRSTVFSSKTAGDAVAVMQEDGNFVVYGDRGQTVLFQTRTAGHPGARLVVQDDGNLVVYATSGKAIFATR